MYIRIDTQQIIREPTSGKKPCPVGIVSAGFVFHDAPQRCQGFVQAALGDREAQLLRPKLREWSYLFWDDYIKRQRHECTEYCSVNFKFCLLGPT